MRVLLVNDFGQLIGGAESHVLSLSKALKANGVEVSIVSSDRLKADSRNSPVFSDYQIPHSGHFFDTDSIYNRKAKSSLKTVLDEFQPDVVHLHNIFYALSPSILDSLKQYPTCMTAHDYITVCAGDKRYSNGEPCSSTFTRFRCQSPLGCKEEGIVKKLRRAMLTKKLSLITSFITPSSFVQKQLQDFGLTQKIEVIYHPFSSGSVAPLQLPSFSNKSPANLLFVGRLSSQKGVDIAIRALQHTSTQVKLIIAGDGPEKESLVQLVDDLKLKERVRFLGWVKPDELQAHFLSSCAVVFPSLWPEVAGLGMYEAAQYGRASIGSSIGAIPEFIEHGKTGLLFKPGDPRDLASCIDTLFSSEGMLEKLSRCSYEKSLSYTMDDQLQLTLAHYRKIQLR